MALSQMLIPYTPVRQHPEYLHFDLHFLKVIMFKAERTLAQVVQPCSTLAQPYSGGMQVVPPATQWRMDLLAFSTESKNIHISIYRHNCFKSVSELARNYKFHKSSTAI